MYRELDSAGITDIKQFSLSPHSPLSDVLVWKTSSELFTNCRQLWVCFYFNFQHRDYRIVVLNSAPVLARRVLCEVRMALSLPLSAANLVLSRGACSVGETEVYVIFGSLLATRVPIPTIVQTLRITVYFQSTPILTTLTHSLTHSLTDRLFIRTAPDTCGSLQVGTLAGGGSRGRMPLSLSPNQPALTVTWSSSSAGEEGCCLSCSLLPTLGTV